MTTHDPVNKPAHYNNHPSGVECIDVVRHLPYELGNVIKYCWRWQTKAGVEDLRKAITYLDHCTSETRQLVGQSITAKIRLVVVSAILDKEPEDTPLRAALELLANNQTPDNRWTNKARHTIINTIQEQETH